MNTKSCPCGRDKKYIDCCKLAHEDISSVKTAEDLMRSRYTAFTKAKGDYLMESHHSSTRPTDEKNAIIEWAKSVKWLKLEVLNTTFGSKDDSEGTVEFKAHYKRGIFKEFIHENSKFIRENGCWVYLGNLKVLV